MPVCPIIAVVTTEPVVSDEAVTTGTQSIKTQIE